MIEYILVAIAVAFALGIIIYYSGKNLPPKSCGNCRFDDKGLCNNETVMHKCKSDLPIDHGTHGLPCKQWDWNGERDEQ